MAGDWIKMRQDLRDDPAVIHISIHTNIDEDAVVGKLHRLWSWADKHTTDGKAPAITKVWVDKYVSHSGFSDAMISAGWISFSESGVCFPSFDVHNGQSAKSRAEGAIRQRLSRKNRDDGVTGEEKTAVPKPFRRHVFNRDGYTCVYCGTKSDEAREATRKGRLSIDHLIPETRGGSAAVSNLVCCCRICNNEKNDRTPEEWGALPEFLQNGVTYENGQMSHKSSDSSVTHPLPEKRREEKNNTDTPAKLLPCPQDLILNLYAEKLPSLPQPRKSLWSSSPNAAALKKRWDWVMTENYESGDLEGQRMAQTLEEGLDWFSRFFDHVSESDFLSGRSGKFNADLGWLVNSTNFQKVVQGNYKNKKELF